MLQYWRRIGSKPILLLAIEQLAFNHLSSETFMWKHNTHNPGIGIVCWHCIVCWHSIFFLLWFFYHNYSDKSLLLQLLQCCTSWDNSRLLPIPFLCQMTGDDNKETWQGERMVAFLFFFFFFCKASNIRCSKDQWIRSKVKNTIPQTVKSIHYLVRQPSHCVLCIAVCSCGCSY